MFSFCRHFQEKVALAVTRGLGSEGSQSDFPLTGGYEEGLEGVRGVRPIFFFNPGGVDPNRYNKKSVISKVAPINLCFVVRI